MFLKALKVNVFDLATAIAKVVDLMNAAVGRHHLQVAYWVHQLSDTLAFSENEKFELFIAGLLHDIGAFSLEERLDLLAFEDLKPGEHAVAGSLLLKGFAPFTAIANLILYHHLPWQNGAGAIQGGVAVPRASHLIHLADRLAVKISPEESVLAQVDDLCDFFTKQSGDTFIPEHVEALCKLKNREYIWLDAVSNDLEAILKRSVSYPAKEFSGEQLMQFSKLICRLIDFKSEFTATHSSGVAAVAVELAKATGFSEKENRVIEIAGYLHDLGKLAIPSEIIEKQDRLSQSERFIMRSHVYHTYQTLESFEMLRPVSQWGSLHQERLNGTGYPFGLAADDLPLGARIMAVADVFTALTEDRPYRKGMTPESTAMVLQSMADKNELDAGLIARVLKHYGHLDAVRHRTQQDAMNEYQAFKGRLEQSSLLYKDGKQDNHPDRLGCK